MTEANKTELSLRILQTCRAELWELFPHLDGETEDLVQVLNLRAPLDKPSPKDRSSSFLRAWLQARRRPGQWQDQVDRIEGMLAQQPHEKDQSDPPRGSEPPTSSPEFPSPSPNIHMYTVEPSGS